MGRKRHTKDIFILILLNLLSRGVRIRIRDLGLSTSLSHGDDVVVPDESGGKCGEEDVAIFFSQQLLVSDTRSIELKSRFCIMKR